MSRSSEPAVAAAIPGRIRLRWPAGSYDPERLRCAAERLSHLSGVIDTTVMPAASSVILRYAPRERDLADMQRDALAACNGGSARSAEPSAVLPDAGASGTANGNAKAQPAGGEEGGAAVAVLEQEPGRVRLRIDRLKGHSQGWAYIEYRLGGDPVIDRVQADVDAGSILISYDETAQDTDGVVRRVRRLLPQALKRKPGHAEIARLRDIPMRPPTKIHPLLLPTAALVFAAIDGIPGAITAGVLAVGAMPIAGRAAEGVRARQFNVDQLDAANVGILAVQGNLLAASGVAWLVGLAELARGKALRSARAAAIGAMGAHPRGRAASHLVANAPLSDTRLQSNAATVADRLAWPSATLGALQFALGSGDWQAAGDAIGLIKPRSDFASAVRFAPPATVLRALAGALPGGVLIRSGKALEKLAHADTVLLDAGVMGAGDRPALAEALCRRGIREVAIVDHNQVRTLGGRDRQPELTPGTGAEAFVERRRAQRRVVAVVTGTQPNPEVLSEADVVLAVDPDGRLAGGDFIDMVLADPDPRLLMAAIDGARRATRILKQNIAIAAGGAAANLAAGLLGISPPVVSQAIATGVIALAGINATRAGIGD